MIPIKLTLENFISHTKSEIDFTKFDVALVIGARDNNTSMSNGSGKTSLFDAIRFAIYNKTRFNAKEKVVKRGKVKSRVEFIFEMNDEVYKVERSFNKKLGVGDVNFYKKVSGKWEAENCDTPTGTTQKIIDTIGMSHDTFVSSVFFRQNDISGFAGASATKRKEILKEVLQIGIWDEYQEQAKEKAKEFNEKKAQVEQRIFDIGNIEERKLNNTRNIEQINLKLSEMKQEIENFEKENKTLSDKIVEEELKLVKIESTSKSDNEKRLKEIVKRAKEIKDQKETIKESVNSCNNIIAKSSSDYNELFSKLNVYAKNVLLTNHKHRDKAKSVCEEQVDIIYTQEKLEEYKIEKDILQRELSTYEIQLANLSFLEPGKECPVCLSAIEDLSGVCQKRELKKKELEKNIKLKKVELKSLLEKITEYEKAFSLANEGVVEIERTELIMSKKMSIISESEKKNEENSALNNSLSWELNSLKAERESILNLLEGEKDNNRDLINSLILNKKENEEQLSSLRESILELSVEQGSLKNKLEMIDRQISEKEVLISQKEQVSFEAEVFYKLSKAFGKDGIQAIIMENITEDLKNFTNNFLETICNEKMSVDFITQTKKTTGDWKEDFEISITMDGSVLEFEDLSGGEQVRVSMAIRLAIGQLLMQRAGSDIRFLLLDEVDQALDQQGVEALTEAIQALAKDFKILLVTHNDSIKEKFNNVITVIKQPTGSIVKQ